MQLDDTYNYPVGFPIPPAAQYFAPKKEQEAIQQEEPTGRLITAHPHQTPLVRTVTCGSYAGTLLERTFTKCLGKLADKIFPLAATNQNLRQQLMAVQLRAEQMTLLHEQRMSTLNAQVLLLKEQMRQLMTKQAEKTKEFKTRLLEAPAAKVTALDLAKKEWEKEKAKLISENQALQNQNHSLQEQIKAASAQCQALKTTLSEEPQRERKAIADHLVWLRDWLYFEFDQNIKGAEDPKYFGDEGAFAAFRWTKNYHAKMWIR